MINEAADTFVEALPVLADVRLMSPSNATAADILVDYRRSLGHRPRNNHIDGPHRNSRRRRSHQWGHG